VFIKASAKVSKTLGVFGFQHQTLGKVLTSHVVRKQPSKGSKYGKSIPIEYEFCINF